MGNLLTSLLNSANTLQAYDRQLSVIQNNISNASTPGYVRQTQTLEAASFNPDHGLPGGVTSGPILSSRSDYAEQTIRNQTSQLGTAQQKAGDLAQLESLFDLTGNSGVASSITTFLKSFSQLSTSPNDGLSRQAVLDSAKGFVASVQQTAQGLATVGSEADTQISTMVATVNRLGGELRDLNSTIRGNYQNTTDAGLDAKLTSTLEELSQTTDVTVIRQADGTASVYLAGQVPLVVGDHEFAISADFSLPQTAVLDSSGRDISNVLQNGKLAGAQQEKNQLVPSYVSDLNNLAQTFADKVNQQLAAGVDANGDPPATDLFTYSTSSGAAFSLGVNALTPDQIAAATPDAPGGNGNALNLADLQSSKTVNGYTFTEYLGSLGGRIGRDVASARSDQQTQQGLVTQAQSLREQVSGVSLDQEAAHLLEVQRSYQASGKLMTVLNQIMDTLMQTFGK